MFKQKKKKKKITNQPKMTLFCTESYFSTSRKFLKKKDDLIICKTKTKSKQFKNQVSLANSEKNSKVLLPIRQYACA